MKIHMFAAVSLLALSTSAFGTSNGGDEGISVQVVATKNILFPNKELEMLNQGNQMYDKDLEELQQKHPAFDVMWSYSNYMRSYKPVGVTGPFDLETAIKTYRESHIKVDATSGLNVLLEAYREAALFHYTVEGEEERGDMTMYTMMQIEVHNVKNGKLSFWIENIKKDFEAGKMDLAAVTKCVKDMEEASEKTIKRLLEKKDLLNQLRSKRLFIEQFQSSKLKTL